MDDSIEAKIQDSADEPKEKRPRAFTRRSMLGLSAVGLATLATSSQLCDVASRALQDAADGLSLATRSYLDGPAAQIAEQTAGAMSDAAECIARNFCADEAWAITTAQSPLIEGIYRIKTKGNTGFALDVPSATGAGDPWIQLYQSNDTLAQTWYVKCVDGKDVYVIFWLGNYNGAQCLNAYGGGTGNGVRTCIYPYDGTAACKWKAIKNDNGTYTFQSLLSARQVLTIGGPTYANGAQIMNWERPGGASGGGSGAAHQQWVMTRVSPGYCNMPTSAGWTASAAPCAYNRLYITCSAAGYLEMLGADPHSMTQWAPSFPSGDGWNGYVWKYRFATWSEAGGQDDIVWYEAWQGSWERNGCAFGHGGPYMEEWPGGRNDGWRNGTGVGCLATYGYGYGGGVLGKHGGLDSMIHVHVYICSGWPGSDWPDLCFGRATFWPRIKIAYHDNGGSGSPAPSYKYIGTPVNISMTVPSRRGYMYCGWALGAGRAVTVSPGQRIGAQDWNLPGYIDVAVGWTGAPNGPGGPEQLLGDPSVGTASPSGRSTIDLYAIWQPVTYKIEYHGNGATSGSMDRSAHTYDAAKTLAANAFKRLYVLTCDAQGGSNGNKSLDCNWPFKHWATSADGSGSTYADRQSIANLTATLGGTVHLHAQWSPGNVALPNPGAKEGFAFQGWFDAPSGGNKVGDAGTSLSISQSATVFAQWKPIPRINYYVDGEPDAVFAEQISSGAYSVNPKATAAGTRANCAGFDGWYTDAACASRFVDGTIVSAALNLYGRNSVNVEYGYTNQTEDLLLAHQFYKDAAFSAPYDTAASEGVPAKASYWYGDTLTLPVFAYEALYCRTNLIGKDVLAIPFEGYWLNDRQSGVPKGANTKIALKGSTKVYIGFGLVIGDGIKNVGNDR